MARKTTRFSGIDLSSLSAPDEPAALPSMSQHRPLAAVRSALSEARQNAVLELDPSQISEGGVADRIGEPEEDLAALIESMRAHGQHVPIMVRPASRGVDRYEVIYGRRRLRAAQALGLAVKAIVRQVDEEELLLIQGQENAHRLELSFIEKANFAGILAGKGYPNGFVAEAINTHPTTVSSMLSVIDRVTQPLVEAIGAAHGAGRRKWLELADRVAGDSALAASLAASLADGLPAELQGEARLDHVLASLAAPLPPEPITTPVAESPPQGERLRERLTVRAEDGQTIGRIEASKRKLLITVEAKNDPEFAEWLGQHARSLLLEMHQRWKSGG